MEGWGERVRERENIFEIMIVCVGKYRGRSNFWNMKTFPCK
jgi:hypothetical protein